ncbi:hypothetical protein [Pseudoduganella aquatica]|uniref:DUF883 family protein n=1 Tax=Pseudoduganella aquatica TaxID=2660641 RepID=A0A7X4HFQ1_9BURK|nr:hypothetical protein [Pseudoduganella aquatica]MYN10335.1 hypothetical protein [Pseudoduganella aquatica]
MENSTDKQSSTTRDTITQFGRDSRADLHGAIDRTAEKVQPTTDRLASTVHATVDKMAEKVPPAADRLAGAAHTAVDRVADTATQVSEQAATTAKQLGDAYTRFAESGRNYVRTSPATSVLIALAAGYGLSKLLGSRR